MWVRRKSEKHDKYYFFNTKTKESVWTRPKTDFHIFHILIKHENSRKPIKVSEEDAYNECISLLKRIKESEEPVVLFKKLAFERSACSSSKRSGDLGYLVGEEMYKEFEEAAFKLAVGDINGPVKTPSGFHIIYRE